MGRRRTISVATAVLVWGLRSIAAERSGIAQEPRSNSASPGRRLVLAYDRPLPDSMSKAIAEVVVLDRNTGAPIARSEVRVKNMLDLKFRSFQGDDRGGLRFVYPFTTVAQASIEVRKEGYVPQLVSWGSDPNGAGREPPPRRLTIRLRPGKTIGGRVTDEHGLPIEGVTVVVSVDRSDPGNRLTDEFVLESFHEIPCQTDRDGRWQTRSCPPGAREISLQLIHPDYISGGCHALGGPGLRRPRVEALFDQNDVQVMAKGLRLEGRVIDAEGKPISGVRLVESSQGFTYYRFHRGTTSGGDGRFHLQCHWDEVIQLTAEARGFAPLTVRATARPDDGPVEIRLSRGQLLLGKVVDPRGRPVVGALVFRQADRKDPFFLRMYTDSRGEFTWEDAPREPVNLSVGKAGYTALTNVRFESGGNSNVVVLHPQARNQDDPPP